MFERRKKAWVAAADMGYGHLRAALPFQDIAQGGRIIAANDYPGIPESDKKIWEDSRRFYEAISRFKKFPVLGDFVFALFDKFQEIKEFYSSAEGIEAPTIQLKQIYRLMEKRNWGRNLIWKLNRKPLPLICTFFTPAHMAEFWKYEGPIYSVVTDTDISRAWAPLRPKKSKIIYCASTKRAAERLKRYGVRQENVVLTGFPLSEEFTKKNAAKAKRDLKRRLEVLDPSRRYRLTCITTNKIYCRRGNWSCILLLESMRRSPSAFCDRKALGAYSCILLQPRKNISRIFQQF